MEYNQLRDHEDYAEAETRVNELTAELARAKEARTYTETERRFNSRDPVIQRAVDQADRTMGDLEQQLGVWSERLSIIRTARSREYLSHHRTECIEILGRVARGHAELTRALEEEQKWREDLAAKGVAVEILPANPLRLLDSKLFQSFTEWLHEHYSEALGELGASKKPAASGSKK